MFLYSQQSVLPFISVETLMLRMSNPRFSGSLQFGRQILLYIPLTASEDSLDLKLYTLSL